MGLDDDPEAVERERGESACNCSGDDAEKRDPVIVGAIRPDLRT